MAKEIKIIGVVVALPPLKAPAYLFRWYLTWKRNQILVPGFRRYKEAVQGLTRAMKGFTQAAKDAGMEEALQ